MRNGFGAPSALPTNYACCDHRCVAAMKSIALSCAAISPTPALRCLLSRSIRTTRPAAYISVPTFTDFPPRSLSCFSPRSLSFCFFFCVKRDRIGPPTVPNYADSNMRAATLRICVKRDKNDRPTVPNYADCLHNYSAHRRRHVRTNAHAHGYGTIRHAPCRTCYDSTRSRDISHRQRKPNPHTQHITRCRR